MPMRYVVRADASQTMGSGHVMRSLTIAEELIFRGESVVFVGKYSEIPWLTEHMNNLGFSQILDSPTGFKSNNKTDVLILDSYTIQVDDKFIQKNRWKNVISLADPITPGYLVDLKICPGISGELQKESNSKILAGPKYVPLRKSIRKNSIPFEQSTSLKILIVGGGTDAFNFVGSVCEILNGMEVDFLAYYFSKNPLETKLDSRFKWVPMGFQLDVLASSAELIFTTASTSCLEFLAREISVGIGCAVDNQRENYDSLVSAGVALPIGIFDRCKWDLDMGTITDLVYSHDLREGLRQRSKGLIDLNGARRIVDEILKL